MKILKNGIQQTVLPFIVSAPFLLAGCSSNFPTGTWEGNVQQTGFDSYPVTMTIDDLAEGEISGRIAYPSLSCSGVLIFKGKEGDTYLFLEDIQAGENNCVDGGTIEVRETAEGNLLWEVRDAMGSAFATLSQSE